MIKPTTPKIYTPQDDSCVLSLDARDVRGSKIYDRSGKGNHGAIVGAVLKPMNYGIPVLEFDGVDDFINCGNDESLNITDEITISMWIKSTTSQAWYGIMAKPNSYVFKYENNGVRPVILLYLSVSGMVSLPLLDDAPLNQFSHIVVTYNNDGTGAKIYLNGELSNIDDTFSGDIDITNDALAIGALSAPPNWEFTGSIAQVRILKRALSPSEISQRFNNSRHLFGI